MKRFFMKKGSIQLSVNFLVMLILSSLLFSLGIYFLFNINNSSNYLLKTISLSEKKVVENLLLEKNFVILHNSIITAKNKETTFIFGLRKPIGFDGILKISVEKKNRNGFAPYNNAFFLDTIKVKDFNNNIYVSSISFPKLNKGEHIFKINICKDNCNDNNIIYYDYIRIIVK